MKPETEGTHREGHLRRQPRREIRARSFAYALRAIKLYQYLHKQMDGAGWIVGKQFPRSAASIGSNIEEAQGAESRGDFIHKPGIAQKEARESLFWLRLLGEVQIVHKAKLNPLIGETEELVAVLISIVVKTKQK